MINTNYNYFFNANSNALNFTGVAISKVKLERCFKEGKSVADVAAMFGVSEGKIYYLIKYFGLCTPKYKNYDSVKSILAPYSGQQLSISRLMELTGLSRYSISKYYMDKYSASPSDLRHKQMITLLKTDLPNKEIADIVNMSPKTISVMRQRLKLGTRERKKENLLNKILEKIRLGLDKFQIAEDLHISISTINRYLKKARPAN